MRTAALSAGHGGRCGIGGVSASASSASSSRASSRRHVPAASSGSATAVDSGKVNGRHAATGDKAPRPENMPGSFYVDHTCIDCDTCRWMAPSVYARDNGLSAVIKQPEDDAESVAAYKALLSCPTFSIHSTESHPNLLKEAREGLPAPVPGCPNVYHNGWTSEKSFAAQSWLITRPEGNILVDSPRFNPVLARQIEKLGGVKYMFLTHKDDVADHEQWQKRFQCQRIIHETEVNSGTRNVELKLKGKGPWKLEDGGDDVELIFTPGHTSGSVCLYYQPSKVMFTGDHLFASKDGKGIRISVDYNWYSVSVQQESVRKLMQYDFLHILPGHGRQYHLKDDFHRLMVFNEWAKQNSVPAMSA